MQRGCPVSGHPYHENVTIRYPPLISIGRGVNNRSPIPIRTSLTTDAHRTSYRATPHQLLMSTAVASEMSCLQSYCNDYPKAILADTGLTF